jgi:hypothetical protein
MSEQTLSEWKEHAYRLEGVAAKQQDEITALRAEVERQKASAISLRLAYIADIDHYRSQLSARDAEVRALQGFAREVIENIYGEGLVKQMANAHGLLDDYGNPTPLLTGEPGPGGER